VKSLLMLIIAIIAVVVVWNLVLHLVGFVLALAIKIALIAAFCYVVYLVFKALTGEKQRV